MANESALHFRQMLAKLSHVIGRRELDSMKYLCMDIIPRAILDEIDSAVNLWVALEERDKLSIDGIQFLDTLLNHACAGRQDVLLILREYRTKTDGITNSGQDLTKEFDIITKHLGRQWRPLARKLNLSEMDIDTICQNYSRDLQEQIRQCLVLWQRNNRDTADRQGLVSVLQSCQLNMIAHQVETVQ